MEKYEITNLAEGPLKRLMDTYFDYIPVFEDHGYYYASLQGYPRKGLKSVLNAVLYSLPKTVAINANQQLRLITCAKG